MTAKKNIRCEEAKAVRVALIQRDWRLVDLAESIGCSLSIAKKNAAQDYRDLAFRAKVERALGTAIWSHPHEFSSRRFAEKVLGYDPHTLRKVVIEGHVRRMKITGATNYDREQLADLLVSFAAKNPTYKPAL